MRRAELVVGPGLSIPEADLTVATSRSGGPGGQNVNKVETRVELRLDLLSAAFSEPQRALLRERLRSRIARDGYLRVVAQRHRTQAANREAARERLAELIREALRPRRPRLASRKPASADRARLEAKRRRAERKRLRTRAEPD